MSQENASPPMLFEEVQLNKSPTGTGLEKWISNVPSLADLFIKWNKLTPGQKAGIDQHFGNTNLLCSYLGMKEGLKRWAGVKDAERVFKMDPPPEIAQEDKDWIKMMISEIDETIDQIGEGNDLQAQHDLWDVASTSRSGIEGIVDKSRRKKWKAQLRANKNAGSPNTPNTSCQLRRSRRGADAGF